MEPLSFKGKTILITGASSGIGEAFAKNFSERGANLIITARSQDKLCQLSKQLESSFPNIWVKAIPADLCKKNAAKNLFINISDLGLSVDYVVNNAGIGRLQKFTDEAFDTYSNMLTLNINALVELSYLFLPAMIKRNHGGIINVASTASFQPLPYQSVYGASKAFVLSFSEALSGELLQSNVRIMALCPGATESNFMNTAKLDTSGMNLDSPDNVVESALRSYSKNQSYTVSGIVNYLTSLMPRILPRRTSIKIVANMFKNQVI